MNIEVTQEITDGKILEDLTFELVTDSNDMYFVEYYRIEKEYDYYCIRVYKTESRELSADTEIAKGYVDSDLGSTSGDELNVENNDELTNLILDTIAERIRVAYIQEGIATNELTEIALNGYRYTVSHAYNVVLDEVSSDETIIESFLLDNETMVVSEYDFSKDDLLRAKSIQFYKSVEI